MVRAADRYTHGHHESVLRSHTWRTAENSAAYLLPHLGPGMSLLDVGCGPGTLTLDLAERVQPGSVVGMDRSTEIIEGAQSLAVQREVSNVHFETGDVYHLTQVNGSMDVVHAHQVLQHLSDPVRALRELHRVLRGGGLLAVRDSDYGAFTWAPADERLDRWRSVYRAVAHRNDAEPDAGRFLEKWVVTAGFDEVVATGSAWTFQRPEDRTWWGNSWADRVLHSDFARQAVEYGLADETELRGMSEAFRDWTKQPDGVFVVQHGEIVARR